MRLAPCLETSRRGFMWSPWAAAALLAAGCGGESEPASTPAANTNAPPPTSGPRPNFVVVVADDLDVYSTELMPRINDLLVQHGVSFSSSFSTNPVSAPSRATLLTGQCSHNHRVQNNTQAFQVFLANRAGSNLATSLHDAGYRTAMIGKLMNSYVGEDPLPGWDEWQAVIFDAGLSAYYNYKIRETGGAVTSYGNEEETDYLSEILTKRALDYLERATEDAHPFFLWLGYNAPHEPADYEMRHQHAFAGVNAPRTPSFNEEDMSDKPSHYQSLKLLTDERIHDLDAYFRARLRCMLSMDEAIERIVKLLEASGKLANTYIVFTSDNGYLQGQHRYFWGKDALYESSIRVPLGRHASAALLPWATDA